MSDSQTDDFSGFGRRFAEAQDRQLAGLELGARARVRARLLEADTRGSSPTLSWLLVPAAALTALLVFFGLSAWSSAPLTFAVGASSGRAGQVILSGAQAAVPLRFSDGSELELLPDSRGRVLSLQAHGARVELERGEMTASVVHRGNTAWAVLAGPFQVTVTGTKFVTRWEPVTQQLVVSVTEGAVLVSGGTLRAAERVPAGKTLQLQIASVAQTPPLALSAPEEAPSKGPSTTSVAQAAPAPSLARAASKSEALRGVLEAGNPTDLVTWSEELGKRGDSYGAARALLALRTRFPNDPRSWLAARTLSEMALRRRDCAEARRWLAIFSARAPAATQLSQAVENCKGSR